jgi:hypothetical protein
LLELRRKLLVNLTRIDKRSPTRPCFRFLFIRVILGRARTGARFSFNFSSSCPKSRVFFVVKQIVELKSTPSSVRYNQV